MTKIEQIKLEAIKKKVPIIFDDTASFLSDFIKKKNPKKILEIGTATGYSSSVMLGASAKCHITTIELDRERFLIAKKNLKPFKNRVKMLNCDAFSFIKKSKKKFDLIFLDGPKGQYGNYLPHLTGLLEKGGSIIADNIYFHGVAIGLKPCTRGMRAMIKGLHDFVVFGKLSPLKFEEFEQGDGIIVLTKEEE